MEAAGEPGPASGSLETFLRDFERAARDFERRGPSGPEAPPQALKTGPPRGLDGSGSNSISPGSSLGSSQEDLTGGGASSHIPRSTAKLGDTRELEAFIADLDQVLKEM